MTRPHFEQFRKALLDYFQGDVIVAEFDNWDNLILFANPYQNFEELAINVCDNILETVYFSQHLELRLYPFGTNEYLKISIN